MDVTRTTTTSVKKDRNMKLLLSFLFQHQTIEPS